jgi:hypothetical protein
MTVVTMPLLKDSDRVVTGRLPAIDVPLHRHQVLITTWFDGSRGGNDTVVAIPERLNERCPNSA